MMTTRERAEIVTKATETAILPTLQAYDPKIVQLHFLYCHAITAQNVLKQMEGGPVGQSKMFPLVLWVEDIAERGVMGDMSTVTPRILVIMNTKETYSREERQELVFKPILWPIVRELDRQIENTGHFWTNYKAPGNITERPFWGREGLYGSDGNIMDAYLDCIEITNKELTIRRANCFASH